MNPVKVPSVWRSTAVTGPSEPVEIVSGEMVVDNPFTLFAFTELLAGGSSWPVQVGFHGRPPTVRLDPYNQWLLSIYGATPQRPQLAFTSDLVGDFNRLADQWLAETRFESLLMNKAMHPAYQRIIGLGAPAVPLILQRLEQKQHQWFWALTSITGQDPAEGLDSPVEAALAWLAWGRHSQLI